MSEEEKYFYSDFKNIRESRNITIEDIVKKTMIQIQYIRAIEKGNFQDLPSVYIRLFLKSYCKVIGLDEYKILIQYNDYIKGNRTNTNTSNRTPKFIENKNKMSNKSLDIDSISNNKNYSYFIQPQKLLSFIFTLLLIGIAWITIAKISEKNHEKYQTIFDNTKLNWEYLNKLSLIDSQNINIKLNLKKNIIKYETSKNIKNKIIISSSLDERFLENRILNENDQEEKLFTENIKFGILNGKINLFINGEKIDFMYNDKAIIGNVEINKKQLDIVIKYFE